MIYIWINPVVESMYDSEELNSFLNRYGYKRMHTKNDWCSIVRNKYMERVNAFKNVVIDIRCPKIMDIIEEVGICDCSMIRGAKRGAKPYRVEINQYSLEGKYIATFSSITDASVATGVPGENICACYKHKYKQAGGYLWFEISDLAQPNNTKLIKEVELQ